MAVEGSRTDVLVAGAGQAGLATGRALAEAGVAFRVHERLPRIGDAWRRRFDSLVLFTPRVMDALPGLQPSGDPGGYPTKDEIADYLEHYAETHSLPITTGDGIARLWRDGPRFLAVTETGREIEARAVVIAAGAFQRPRIPGFAARLSGSARQLDAVTYRNPESVAGQRVTIVGDGATGRQIALELAAAGNDVTLAMGHRRNFGPQRVLGKDANRWALKLGLLTAGTATLRGRLVRALDVTPGRHLRAVALQRAGIRLAPRCIDASASGLSFADGRCRECDTVLFALGYRDETEWIGIDGATDDSGLTSVRGISPVPGLYHVGREWQTCRASSLLCGVYRDAAMITSQVKRYLAGN